MIPVGTAAPAFELEDQFGVRFRSSDWRGRRQLLLAFYPLDFTPT